MEKKNEKKEDNLFKAQIEAVGLMSEIEEMLGITFGGGSSKFREDVYKKVEDEGLPKD